MADLNAAQVTALRKEIKKRYGKDIDKKIKKLVFVMPGKTLVSFTAENDFKEPEPPKPHKPVYRLYIYEESLQKEPSIMMFGALDAAMYAFRAQQHNGHLKLVLMEDAAVLQVYDR